MAEADLDQNSIAKLKAEKAKDEEARLREIGDRPVRVYADGIYDLFHFGHARSLEQAKKAFPNTYLLVGCCNDEVTHKYKGKTVMTDQERYESLRHCKWVDEVIPDAPWVINQEFLDKHKIDFVAHDSLPYADASGAANDVYEFVKKVGKFKETKRTEGISTSDIIMRIVKDYNEYVMRNLARGYTRKELGVSYVREKRIMVNMGLKNLRDKVKEQQEKVNEKLNTVRKLQEEWVENADRWVAGFLEKFEEGCHVMGTAIKEKLKGSFSGSLIQYDDYEYDDFDYYVDGDVEDEDEDEDEDGDDDDDQFEDADEHEHDIEDADEHEHDIEKENENENENEVKIEKKVSLESAS